VITRRRRAFTLIEMIGVMAIISVLAAVLLPKILTAIDNSRVNNAAMSINTAKAACVEHYAKFGSFLVDGSQTPPAMLTLGQQNFFDQVLLTEAFLDRPFATKIGSGIVGTAGTHVEVFDSSTLTSASVVTPGETTGFNLDGDAADLNDVVGSVCVQAVIKDATAADAKALNDLIDGAGLGAAGNSADIKGRVKYGAPVNGVTTIYVYLTHR